MSIPGLYAGVQGGASSYSIANSLRLRSSASAYLSRTFGTPTDNKKWTWRGLVKRGNLTTDQTLIEARTDANNRSGFYISGSNTLVQYLYIGGANVFTAWATTAVFRDPTAWYDIQIIWDTANATAGDRLQVYVNGARQTFTGGAIALNQASHINSATAHVIGRFQEAGTYLDGYLSEINFIDGQALTPSSFGEQNSDGVWVPKRYTGTYGNNGFKLDFSNGSSTTTLGYDSSGNGNNWTLNNISLTAGATYDWLTDTPTNNYATLNPIRPFTSSALSLVDGNLKLLAPSNPSQAVATMPMFDGSYCEVTVVSIDAVRCYVGVVEENQTAVSYTNPISVLYSADGYKYVNTTPTAAYGATYTNNDVIGVAYKNGKVYFSKNGVWQNSGDPVAETGFAASGYSAYRMFLYLGHSTVFAANFGQRPFAYTPPTGFKALCTANMPMVAIPKPKAHFDAKTWTATGASQNITGIGFQPDFVWNKSRASAYAHWLYDAVRGATKALFSSNTNAEATYANSLTAFNSDGFTVGADDSANSSGAGAAVSWLWKAGGAGVSNTDGSITSTVSSNTTAGFSIVTYTGTGANATVGHGLGVAPKMIIVKRRNDATNWPVWHHSISNGTNDFVQLNLTSAKVTDASFFTSTAPTSTVFSLGSGSGQTNSGTLVAYCFAEIPGFSKFGSYAGNGSADGPFVYCGFRPKYLMVKASTASPAGGWILYDTARDTYNQATKDLRADLANAEPVSSGPFDILSNGFKLRGSDTNSNGGSNTYIFAAFAEHPMGGANVSPAPAR